MDSTNIATQEVGNANQLMQDRTLPTFAVGMSLFGGINSVDFWGLIQTDLQRKNLAVNAANLQVNFSNNLLLRENLALAKESTSQLYSINNQLGQLNDIIARKVSVEERENFARELIYNINKMDAALATNSDKAFVSFEAKSLIFLIEKNNITTASFTQIQDKEYFEKILSSLKLKADDISQSEQKDLEGFVSIYTYGLSLLDEYRLEKPVKVINVPEDFITPEKPERDPILDCENELEDAIASTYKELGLFSSNLKRYISTTDELPTFFEKFYKAKEEYKLNTLKYQLFKTIGDALKKQDKVSDITAKINCCSAMVDKYLELHPDLEKDYPKISTDMATEVIDYVQINGVYQKNLEAEMKELKNYYSDISFKLANRNSTVVSLEPEETPKKKKGLFSFWKK